MTNFIAILVLLAIVATAALSVVRAKKRGQKCIGCPHSGSCGKCSCQ